MKTPVLIYGSKGASKEAYYMVKDINSQDDKYELLGFVENDERKLNLAVTDGKKVITVDSEIEAFVSGFDKVAIVIPFGDPSLKTKIFDRVKEFKNAFFPNIIHPTAIVSNMKLGQGNIVAPGAVLACDSEMGDFNLINRLATIGHDCSMGNFNSVCPGVVVSGGVTIGDACSIGANATILQGLEIKAKTVVGAGAVVTHDTGGEETVVGIPARKVEDE